MSLPGFTAAAALSRVPDQHYIPSAVTAVKLSSAQSIVPQHIPPVDPDPSGSSQGNTNCDISVRCIYGRQYWTLDCPDGGGGSYWGGWCFLPAISQVETRSVAFLSHREYTRLCPC
jgi:hypothetical protein